MVQVVLHWAWDPIGVRGFEMAADEYDIFTPAVLAMLEEGATEHQLGDYLTSVVRDRMELTPKPNADQDVASMLRELYAIRA